MNDIPIIDIDIYICSNWVVYVVYQWKYNINVMKTLFQSSTNVLEKTKHTISSFAAQTFSSKIVVTLLLLYATLAYYYNYFKKLNDEVNIINIIIRVFSEDFII